MGLTQDPKPIFHTYSGEKFRDFTKHVSSKQIHIQDIARGLSHLGRFSGQSHEFYSVAAHSIKCAEWVEAHGGSPLEALTALLHDASEAYINDLISPVKYQLPEYLKMETNFMRAIAYRFGIIYPLPAIVVRADKETLKVEIAHNQVRMPIEWGNKFPEKEFLRKFEELRGASFEWRRLSK